MTSRNLKYIASTTAMPRRSSTRRRTSRGRRRCGASRTRRSGTKSSTRRPRSRRYGSTHAPAKSRQAMIVRHPVHPTLFARDCFHGTDMSFKTKMQAFYDDLRTKAPHHDDLQTRARQRAANHERALSRGLLDDLEAAGVSVEAYNDMILGKTPLGLTEDTFVRLCTDLIAAINESPPFRERPGNFRIIFSGTGTTFYSENPQKFTNGRSSFFDERSDIDIALVFEEDEWYKRVTLTENHPPRNRGVRAQQVSQSDTCNALNLYDFHKKYGPHDYMRKPTEPTVTGRNVGVVLLRNKETALRNDVCKNSIVVMYDHASKTFRNRSLLSPPSLKPSGRPTRQPPDDPSTTDRSLCTPVE